MYILFTALFGLSDYYYYSIFLTTFQVNYLDPNSIEMERYHYGNAPFLLIHPHRCTRPIHEAVGYKRTLHVHVPRRP